MPLPKNAADDSLHRFNCCEAFARCPPKAWEFLFYIPNPQYPVSSFQVSKPYLDMLTPKSLQIKGDLGLKAHFCLVLPDAYKESSCKSDPAYRAIALITRRPQSSTKSQGHIILRPHTDCTCARRPSELETSVVNRELSVCKQEKNPCHLYDRTSKQNRGHFETWSWYDDSVIPIQTPKMVHVDCLHLKRPLTQPRFGLILDYRSALMFDEGFKRFKKSLNMNNDVGQKPPAVGGTRSVKPRTQCAMIDSLAVMVEGIGI